MKINVNDVEADNETAKALYDIDLVSKENLPETDALIFAVPHRDYLENKSEYLDLLSDNGIVFDIKGIIQEDELKENQSIWRL
ncbi:hypothetical protein BU032_13485 [Staphylococcus simulans]|nr:hypothetical protein BU032_13485 [Staphylococcus simulans]